MRRYLGFHIRPGSFLQAVLRNDLKDAVLRADPDNLHRLRDIVLWIDKGVPGQAQGSQEAIEEWCKKRNHGIESTNTTR
jgi:hypothetical protein